MDREVLILGDKVMMMVLALFIPQCSTCQHVEALVSMSVHVPLHLDALNTP